MMRKDEKLRCHQSYYKQPGWEHGCPIIHSKISVSRWPQRKHHGKNKVGGLYCLGISVPVSLCARYHGNTSG